MISPKTATIVVAATVSLGCWGQTAVAADQPAVTLTVATPTGTSMRLELLAGSGWKFVASDDAGPLLKAALTTTAAPRSTTTAASETPLTVFIDWPTGFVFAYLADRGWNFAGSSGAGARSIKSSLATTEAPMTTFVDGPTGFIFTYEPEAGWKFSGRVGDTEH